MDSPASSLVSYLLLFLVTALSAIYIYFKWSYTYWEKRGLACLAPTIPFGDFSRVLFGKQCVGVGLQEMYEELKAKGVKHGGFYVVASPIYMPLDPEYIKLILIKDFNHFSSRNIYYNEKHDPIFANLLTMDADRWRPLRVKISPVFTSGKMKTMFNQFLVCGDQLKELVDGYATRKEPVEIKYILDRFTTDVIGSCAFGLECNTLKNPDAEIRTYCDKIFKFSLARSIALTFARGFPNLARSLGVRAVQSDVSRYFMDVIENTIAYREKNNIVRKDFLQLLLDVRNNAENESQSLSVAEITAQSFLFFAGGFETSSSTMTFCLYELAFNPDIQEKLRDNINSVLEKHDNEIRYEALMEMQYLDNVINETLRKYPPFPAIERLCTLDYKVPGTNIELKKGTGITISSMGVHYDPDIYPDPYKFDPDRFNEENKAKRPSCSFLPFGEGPRNCIGLRFGLLQTKVGLTFLLKNFKFSLNSKFKLPMELERTGFILKIDGGVWVDIEKIADA